MKFIGVVGSRRRATESDRRLLFDMLDFVWCAGDWLVSGGCYKGADQFAEEYANARSISMLIYYADWDQYGKAAGPIRNKLIARDSDVLIALCAPDRTGGTESTVAEMVRLNRYVIYV